MHFQIAQIKFDLDCDSAEQELPSKQDCIDLHDSYIGTIWQADDEDDLIEEITSAAGWCILSIDYRHVLR